MLSPTSPAGRTPSTPPPSGTVFSGQALYGGTSPAHGVPAPASIRRTREWPDESRLTNRASQQRQASHPATAGKSWIAQLAHMRNCGCSLKLGRSVHFKQSRHTAVRGILQRINVPRSKEKTTVLVAYTHLQCGEATPSSNRANEAIGGQPKGPSHRATW